MADAEPFTALDWIGAVIAGLSGLGLLLFFPLAGQGFASMFREFGADRQLPTLTRLAISWWFPMIFGALVAVGVLLGVRSTAPVQQRRAFIVGAFVLGLVGFAVCLIGAYLPIFALADSIKAE